MGDVVRTLLSTAIKALEQGAFQEFCLSFLPYFDSRFRGMERHGGTADGKTRAGTPDLIKTLADGSHICIQCSVEKDYWSRPANVDEWKPIKDVTKCVKEISNIKEIVLCSSQEIPTNLPNTKSDIIRHSKKITKAEITIFSISNFEEEISKNKDNKYTGIIKAFCPVLYEYVSSSARRYAAETTLDFYKKYPAPLGSIEAIVRQYLGESFGGTDLKRLELEVSKISRSRFQRSLSADFKQIKRKSVSEFKANNRVLGTIHCVLGVPKIGKTIWVSQLCNEMRNDGIEIVWFDTPYELTEQRQFIHDFRRIIIGKTVGFEIANQYADNKIDISELTSRFLQSESAKPYLIVVDNAEHLTDEIIRSVRDFVTSISNSPVGIRLGYVLISNKNLNAYLGNVATDLFCPKWDKLEIEQLLILSKIKNKNDLKKYSELLAIFSGGHPLIALNLARKAPTIAELLPIKLSSAPALYDEDLTEEVKQFLFSDLLKDMDHRDFILRLSALISRFDLALMDFISSKIAPSLRTPVKLMFENLRGVLIEGDERSGYQIAFIFKQVAVNYLSDDLRQQIYDRVGHYLMTPKNNVINGDHAIDAIFYAIIAKNLQYAFLWAMMLFYPRGKPVTSEQWKYILYRLSFIEVLNFPVEIDLKVSYTLLLIVMALKYSKIYNVEKSNELLNKILANPLEQTEVTDEMPFSAVEINTSVRIYLIFNLMMTKDFDAALKIINLCDVRAFIEVNSKSIATGNYIAGFLSILIKNGNLDNFPTKFISGLIKTVSFTDDFLLGELALCFLDLGVVAHNKNNYDSLKETLQSNEYTEGSLGNLFAKMAYAQYELESSNPGRCLELSVEILNSMEVLSIRSNKLKIKILLLRGDAFYQIEDYENALAEYSAGSDLLVDYSTFDYAWTHYRIGLSTTNNHAAIEHFSYASNSFEKLGYLNLKARSEGEKAVALYNSGNIEDAVDIIANLAEDYYARKIDEYGPAVTIGLSSSTRLMYELEGKPLEEQLDDDKVYPKLGKRVFAKVLNIAKPEAGICSAFTIFSNIYKLLGAKDKQNRSLEMVFGGIPSTQEDRSAKVISGVELFGLHLVKGNEQQAFEIIDKLFAETIEYGSYGNRPYVFYIFPQLEQLLKQSVLSFENYKNILNHIEKNVVSLPAPNKYWWLAQVYMRKGGINGITEEKYYDPALLLKSWSYAIKSNNYDVMRESGHQIGFRYFSELNSFQKVAEVQLSVILGICNDGGDIERLETVGENLRDFWKVISFRRLTESDLPYWRNLRDRTINICNKAPAHLHAPLMISLLLLANKAENKSDVQKARVWAVAQMGDCFNAIPEDEKSYIKGLFS
jgi:hypothetical protein